MSYSGPPAETAGRGIGGRFWTIWSAVVVAAAGRQVSGLAIPLIAVLTLDASAGQMGALVALESAPALMLSLLIGAWVDRARRRPLLIGANLVRAVALATIPVLWMTNALTFGALAVTAFVIGACGSVFEIAFRTYVPTVVARRALLRANSRLELGRSAAEIVGPGLAGALLQLVVAPVAILADAASRLVSTALLLFAPRDLPARRAHAAAQAQPANAMAGIRQIGASPVLAPTAAALGLAGFFNGAVEAVFLLFIARELGLEPFVIGAIFACGSVGFIVGALLPERLAARIGLGWSLTATLALIGVSDLLVPLATGPTAFVIALLAGAQFLFGVGLTAFSANEVTLRQATTPPDVLGRVNAAFYMLSNGSAPLGALLGGALGAAFGLRQALFLAAIGELLAILPLLARRFRAGVRSGNGLSLEPSTAEYANRA